MSDEPQEERVAGDRDEPGRKWSERKLPKVPGEAHADDDGLTPHAKARQEFLARSGGQHLNDERETLKKGWEEDDSPKHILQGTDLTTAFDEPDPTRDRISDVSPMTDSDDTSYTQPDPNVSYPLSEGYHLTGDGTEKQRQ